VSVISFGWAGTDVKLSRSAQSKRVFLKKKKQSLFPSGARLASPRPPKEQMFFGSFFQKSAPQAFNLIFPGS
jgi:hypothetical protein